MLEVRNIRAVTFDLDRLDLWWEIESTSEDPQDYDFYVLRGGSPLGPYDTIAGPLVDLYHFRDIQTRLLHQWRDTFYRVRLVHRATGEEKFFPEDDGVNLRARPSLNALEIRSQLYVLFREKIGRLAWVLKVRRFGMICPNCANEYTGRRSRSKCMNCYGTSFVGGYHSPMECLINIEPSSKSDQHMSVEKTEQVNTTAKAMWFPPLDPGDVIVEADNQRWRVYSQSQTELLRAPAHQILQLHAIPPGDVEYELPIEVDEQNLEPSPPREFTNPHNPGELPKYLRELHDLYGARRS